MLSSSTNQATDAISTQYSFSYLHRAQVMESLCAFLREFNDTVPQARQQESELVNFQLLNTVHSVLAPSMTSELLPDEFHLFNGEVLGLMRQYAQANRVQA